MSFVDSGEVKRAIRRGEAFTLQELVEVTRGAFYGDRRKLYYPESWLAVHFLNHGRDGWADEAFVRFLLYVAEGYPPVEVFPACFGAAPADLEAEFREYVKRF